MRSAFQQAHDDPTTRYGAFAATTLPGSWSSPGRRNWSPWSTRIVDTYPRFVPAAVRR